MSNSNFMPASKETYLAILRERIDMLAQEPSGPQSLANQLLIAADVLEHIAVQIRKSNVVLLNNKFERRR